MASVKHEDGRVWIEGVPTLGWGTGRECTFAGALSSALAVTEHPWSYCDIMGLTGLAFRVRWYHGRTGQRWCPSSPVGEFPEEISAFQQATGWRLRVECLLGREDLNMERFAADIVASIDAGRPVPAYEKNLNLDVIYGYEDGGKTFLVRDYFQPDEPLRLAADEVGPMVILLVEHTQPLGAGEALQESLRAAVRNWRRDPLPSEKGEYHYGEAALSAWADDLAHSDRTAGSEDERKNLFFVSWWNFGCLADARQAAVRFLEQRASDLDGDRREALARAASLYRDEGELLGAAFSRKDAFLGPWSGKSPADWSAEVRQREGEILSEARKLEAAAVAEMAQALPTGQ